MTSAFVPKTGFSRNPVLGFYILAVWRLELSDQRDHKRRQHRPTTANASKPRTIRGPP